MWLGFFPVLFKTVLGGERGWLGGWVVRTCASHPDGRPGSSPGAPGIIFQDDVTASDTDSDADGSRPPDPRPDYTTAPTTSTTGPPGADGRHVDRPPWTLDHRPRGPVTSRDDDVICGRPVDDPPWIWRRPPADHHRPLGRRLTSTWWWRHMWTVTSSAIIDWRLSIGGGRELNPDRWCFKATPSPCPQTCSGGRSLFPLPLNLAGCQSIITPHLYTTDINQTYYLLQISSRRKGQEESSVMAAFWLRAKELYWDEISPIRTKISLCSCSQKLSDHSFRTDWGIFIVF